jgi:hypothetical protein
MHPMIAPDNEEQGAPRFPVANPNPYNVQQKYKP